MPPLSELSKAAVHSCHCERNTAIFFTKGNVFLSRIFSHRLNVYVQDEFFRRQREAWTSEAIMNKLSGILPKKIFNRKIKISEKIGKTPKRSFSVKNLVIITGFRWIENPTLTPIFTFLENFKKDLTMFFFVYI